MAKNYDVIVVGGGPGGVSCAALLAKWGLKTLVLERNERCGGKFASVSTKGFKSPLGPMAMAPLRSHSAVLVLRELGLESEFKPIPSKSSATSYRGRSGKWNTVISEVGKPRDPSRGQFDQLELDTKEQEIAQRVMTELSTMPPEKVDALDDISFETFITQYEIPGPLRSRLGNTANSMGIAPIDVVSAGEQIRMVQQGAIIGRNGVGFCVGGFGHLYEVIAESVKANGGGVQTRARVERITVDNGRVTGAVTTDGDFKAPIVISNAGIQPTVLKLVGEQHFDKSYVNYVKDLLPGWGFTAQRYYLSKPVLQINMFSIFSDDSWLNMERYLKIKAGQAPTDVSVFATVPSNFDPAAAPPGKQVVIAGTLCSPDPEAAEIKMVLNKVDETILKVWPDIEPALEFKESMGPAEISKLVRDHVLPGQGGEAEGLGRQVDQSGTRKPSPKAPVRGLFYVGGDAGGITGVGTHEAVGSGIRVARTVLQYYRMRQGIV